jgi:hypothetical protein
MCVRKLTANAIDSAVCRFLLILRNERLQATVSSYINGESPNPVTLSITITQPCS